MKENKEKNHYYSADYDSKERFISYWYQINEIISNKPDSILEIGIGNSFIAEYLKKIAVKAVTLDINRQLNPVVVGSVLCLPFAADSFELVVCYEVLEHLSYVNFRESLSELFRVSKKIVILSLPDINSYCSFNIKVPRLKEMRALIPLPKIKRPGLSLDKDHNWEIGKEGYPLRKIIKDIVNIGFGIKKTYRLFEHPYHRFFVLEK